MKLINKINFSCQAFSLLITFAYAFVVLLSCWIEAYKNPSMSVVVYINRYNEAFPELILWIILVPICAWGFWLNVKMVFEKFKSYEITEDADSLF
jgi:hypothetical protein